MARASFFALLLVACGSPPPAERVEIAQLPTPTVTAEPAPPPPPSHATDEDDVRDPRALRVVSKAILDREAPLLEQLASTTAKSDPNRPALLLRLAETYVLLRKAGDASASQKAVHWYDELTLGYPSFAQADRAWFGVALEYEAAGDWSRARRAYYELIKTQPSSKYAPYAYYAFAELFRKEAKSDPSKWPLAQQAYFEVTKYTTSPIAGQALCRLGEVYDAQGDTARAQTVRDTVARDYPSTRCGGP